MLRVSQKERRGGGVDGLGWLLPALRHSMQGWTFEGSRCRPVSYAGCGMLWRYFGSVEECQEGD